MRKIVFAVFLLYVTSAHAWWTLTCKANIGTGLTECAYYGISAPNPAGGNWQQYTVPYATLVPPGETRQIHVTAAHINGWANAPTNIGGHTLLIEAPTASGKWDVPLCLVKDSGGTCTNSFNPGLMIAPGDSLCLQSGGLGSGVPSNASYAIHFVIGP